MAYNVAANMQFAKPVSAFIDARDNVVRNALAERQVANAEENTAFQQQRLTAADQIVAQQRKAEEDKQDATYMHNALSYLTRARDNPQVYQSISKKLMNDPVFQKHGGLDEASLTPENIQAELASLAATAGIAPPADNTPKVNIQEGPMGSQIITYDNTMRVLEPQQPVQPEKPVLTDVRLPNGRIQKQWVRPGQASGTPVGEPVNPDTGPTMRDVTGLRKEFESTDAAKQYRAVLPLFNRAKTAPNTRAGDISMIYALGKMFDPTSVVREGELVLAQNAAPWLQKMASQANSQLSAKGALSPETRATILEALQGQVDSFRIPYDQERQRYSQYATEYGIDPFKVVGNDASAAFSSDAKSPDPKTMNLPSKLSNGWILHTDANGNKAYVSPDGKQFKEVQ